MDDARRHLSCQIEPVKSNHLLLQEYPLRYVGHDAKQMLLAANVHHFVRQQALAQIARLRHIPNAYIMSWPPRIMPLRSLILIIYVDDILNQIGRMIHNLIFTEAGSVQQTLIHVNVPLVLRRS
ncbi:hypothetical protein D3C84_686990 [compost metagenome]